jgi:hypothetical protein
MRLALAPILLLMIAGCVAGVQEAPPATAPAATARPATAAPVPVSAARPAAVPIDPDTCEHIQDGDKMARLQSDAYALLDRVRSNPAYGWARFDHSPCFRFVVAFAAARPPWVEEAASAELRPYLAFAVAERSSIERERLREALAVALKATGVEAVYATNGTDDPIQLYVATDRDAQAVLAAMPAEYRPLVRTMIGPLPRSIPERG